MTKSAFPLAVVFGAALSIASAWGAAPAIGIISGSGEVTDGAAIHTAVAPSDIDLASGVALRLSPRSDGTLFHDHLVLEEGAVRVENFRDYRIHARDLQVEAAEPAADAVVRITGKTIEVASLRGTVNVSDGAMLTRVTSGTHVSFRQAVTQNGTPTHKALPSDTHVMTWMIGITAAAALAIGLTAAAQGKSPF